GYILGGISWFAVPLLAATTMGLAAVSFDAVSSIITYDLYKTYFNREASGNRLIYISHVSVLTFGLIHECLIDWTVLY
ncbi:unnamed protein product, partial [Rotaria magnacalcarata]